MVLFPKDEIKRKTFHLLILVYVSAYWLLPYHLVLWGMGSLLLIVGIGEILRLRSPKFNGWILGLLGGVHRPEESNKVSGMPWTILGSFLTMLLFADREIVILSLLFLAFGDTFAALFGKRFGKTKLLWGKTLEGSLACFAACLIIGVFFLDLKVAFLVAVFVAVIELFPWPLNDNFWLPLLTAGFLKFMI